MQCNTNKIWNTKSEIISINQNLNNKINNKFRFFLGTHSSDYNMTMFIINFVSLFCITVPKFPQMHKVRLFGINKID